MPTSPEMYRGNIENKYALSTASILDQATLVAALSWGVSDHVDVAHSTGYQGVEIWPQRMRGRSFNANTLTTSEKEGITSVHQSVGKRFWQAPSLRELQKAVFLPPALDSLPTLEQVREQVGDVPIVLFKETPTSYLSETGFTQRGIQTDPETCYGIGATNAEEFVEGIHGMGFTHVVVDTHHIRRSHVETGEPNPLADWRQSLPVLLPHTNEVHLGVGRTDYGDVPAEQVRAELDDLLNGGRNNTEVIQMLHMIADLGWNGLVVIEMRPSELPEKNALGQLSRRSLMAGYERIRQTLAQTMG